MGLPPESFRVFTTIAPYHAPPPARVAGAFGGAEPEKIGREDEIEIAARAGALNLRKRII